MSGDRNWDSVKDVKATAAQSEPDNFSSERMGGRQPAMINVAMDTSLSYLPSCQDIIGTAQQMDTRNNIHLLDRMDQFTGGALKTEGVTYNQLDAMMKSDRFSQNDKAALATMEHLFQNASGRNGDPAHMTMRELAMAMIDAGARQQCAVPGQANNGSGGPPRRKG